MMNRSMMIQVLLIAVLSLVSVACAGTQAQSEIDPITRAINASPGYGGGTSPLVRPSLASPTPQFAPPNLGLTVTNESGNFVEPLGPVVPVRCASGPDGQLVDCDELVWVQIMRPNSTVPVWAWVIPPWGTAEYAFQRTGDVKMTYNSYAQTVPVANAVGTYSTVHDRVGLKDCTIALRVFNPLRAKKRG